VERGTNLNQKKNKGGKRKKKTVIGAIQNAIDDKFGKEYDLNIPKG